MTKKTIFLLIFLCCPLAHVFSQLDSTADCEQRFQMWKQLQDPTQTEWRGAVELEPEILSTVPPIYPDSAMLAGIEADVMVWLMVDTSGNATCARILKSAGKGFDEAALNAITKWQFKPAVSVTRGKLATPMTVPFRYRMHDKE